jgi:DNA-binding transcriptional ArsR family regulator
MEDEGNRELVEDTFTDKPYSGLFGDSALIRIVEEIVADPYSYYRPKDFEEITGSSTPSVRKALTILTDMGLLKKDSKDPQHPIYQSVLGSKTLLALTFLSYAMIDDKDGTNCLEEAIIDYYRKVVEKKRHNPVEVTAADYDASLESITIKLSNGKDISFTCSAEAGRDFI